MSIMDFLPSDLEHMNTNFLDMIENDVNSQLLEIENLNSDKLNDLLNGDLIQDDLKGSPMDFENEDMNSNWFQNELNLQWSDISKVPQSLIDASSEIENNNPNLLVNPQSVLPMHSTQQVQNNVQQVHQLNVQNVRNGIAVKINGQDAVLTPTQHPQIQYVTVQNVNNSQVGYSIQPITICPQQIRNIQTLNSPSMTSPVLVEHLQNGVHTSQTHVINNNRVVQNKKPEKVYPKPVYSYSCLIAMALKNSKTGNLPVSEIYNFMIDNFPYFKTAPDGWKNSVRHNLSLNKCFAKVDSGKPAGAHTRKGCLWALNPAKIEKMEEEIVKWRKKDPESVKLSMSKPENLELIEAGKAGPPRSESDELPSTPVKIEPQSTPVKRSVQSQVSQTPICHQTQTQLVQREATVLVKADPDHVPAIKEVHSFDPALNDLGLQNSLWDDDLSIGVGITTTQSSLCLSPHSVNTGSLYHGNITYATSPLVNCSPLRNATPTKMYPQTPTKIYPQTPSRVVLA